MDFFLSSFSGLDVHMYASRPEERRFLLKSDYPLNVGCHKFAFVTAPLLLSRVLSLLRYKILDSYKYLFSVIVAEIEHVRLFL